VAGRSAHRGALRAPAVSHLAIPVRRLARSIRFYRGVLGMEIAWHHRGMADLRAGRRTSGFDLTLTQDRRADGRASPIHFGWRLASPREVGRWETRLRAAGVRIEGRRAEGDGGLGIYFRDPDGYELEVYAEGT
jgi:catechol 2,3-dioxygenase-like lactoylglutathione lyase family enzyme